VIERAIWLALISIALIAVGRPALGEEPEPEPQPEPEIEVVVRGESSSSRDPTAASTVVRREALRRPGAAAADVIASAPGVQLARTGSSADLATASIRGASSAQTPVYLSGIRLNDDLTGTADLSQVPLWMLDRIEVFRGNAPFEADRLGIGGAIFFEPSLPSRPRIGGGIEIGSFGALAGFVGGALADDGAGSLVGLRQERADNDFEYTDDRGTLADPNDDRRVRRQNADHDSTDAWAIGRWRIGPGGARMTLVTNAFRREQGVTGLGVIPALSARASVQRFLAGVSAGAPCRAGCELWLSSSLLESQHDVRDPAGELGLAAPEVVSSGRRFVQEARIAQQLGEGWRLRAGIGQELELLRVDAIGVSELAARRAATRATLAVQREAGALLVHGLGALECHGTSGPDGADRCGAFVPSGRVGVAVRASEHLMLLANAGRAVRVPTLGELYGVSPAVRGNSELSPETSVSADVGVRAGAGRVSAEAHAFSRWVNDLMAFRRSGFGYVRPFNVGTARVLGAELFATADAGDHVRAEVALTALDPRDTSDDRQLTNDLIPYQSRLVATARSELYARRPLGDGALERVALGGRVSHRSSRVADAAGLIVLDAQTTFDLDLTALLLSERIALRAAIQNLFDARRFDVLGFPLPGRSYHAAAEAWWW
jgi:vitamin B12 transporter